MTWIWVDTDCTAVGFSGEGRCIEDADENGLCRDHATHRPPPPAWDANA